MKDRFKTRIFDKTTNIMHYNDFVITSTGYVAKLERVNLAEAYNKSPELWNSENDTLFINQEDFDFDEKMIVMQCTGLKDKNGKLIYEGDIIEFTDNVKINGSKTHIAKVEHREEFNAYMYHAECMGWYTINPSQNEVFKVKVIGNKYENPELLEKDYEN